MATMKFYNVTAVPTISSAEGTYYVKDTDGYVQEYLVTGGLVKYIGGYPMQDKGTDVEKPMSQKAVTDELNKKVDIQTQINEYPLTGNITLTKADIGLSRVDDTSDISKPVSTAQQAALDGKLDKSSVKQAIGTSTTDVMSQKAVTDAIANSLWYGIEFDTAVSSPTCTRIGNSDLHKTLPIQSCMKGCLLDDNGNVVEYLNSTDWTSNVRDGSRGQVMVEIPMHYIKFETEGTKRRVCMSTQPLPGYNVVPKVYVSAYEATVQRSTSKLCSVVSNNVDYRGGNNNADYDGTYRSFLGRPATSIGRQDFLAYARNRKSGSTEWNCYTYDVHKTLFWLFVVEYATLNSQAAYNSEPTSEGYRQGGLGEGVTTLDRNSWTSFNGICPFVPCGHTDSLGNLTGVVSYTAKNDDGSISKAFDVPRYRGIENPFGHIWKWTAGCNIQMSASQENGGTGLSKAFICHNPANFQDSGYANYSYVGNIDRVSGYIKEVLFGVGGDILSKLGGGGSTTYFCDYNLTSIPTSGESFRGLLLGGNVSYGASAGLASAASVNSPLVANTDLGSRLCFIPSLA